MAEHETEYTGYEFNKIYGGNESESNNFYKFLKDDLKYFECEYKIGLNTDINFDSRRKNSNKRYYSGFRLYDDSTIHKSWHLVRKKLAVIVIPNDARVYVYRGSVRTDKIIIKEIFDENDIPDYIWFCICHKYKYVSALKYIKHQTESLCESLCQINGMALEYVINQTEEICKIAVQQYGYALKYVKEQTDEICKLAVQQNGNALLFVKEQTPEICSIAVQQNGLALEYVINQTEDICKLAVQKNGNALAYVKEQTEEICKIAVIEDGLALEYVINQTEDICKLAVESETMALMYVKVQTYEICQIAMDDDYYVIKFVDDKFKKDGPWKIIDDACKNRF